MLRLLTEAPVPVEVVGLTAERWDIISAFLCIVCFFLALIAAVKL